jgi:hypothetical protein
MKKPVIGEQAKTSEKLLEVFPKQTYRSSLVYGREILCELAKRGVGTGL